jgi:hypothetical protein
LALGRSTWEQPQFDSLEYEKLREVVLDSQAITKLIMLDCCFSGRVATEAMGSGIAVLDQLEVSGTYVLASAARDQVALILPGERHTAFTGRLIRAVREGIPGGPELLTIESIYRHLRATLQAEGLPIPLKRGTDTAEMIALGRNRLAAKSSRTSEPTRNGNAGAERLTAATLRIDRTVIDFGIVSERAGQKAKIAIETGDGTGVWRYAVDGDFFSVRREGDSLIVSTTHVTPGKNSGSVWIRSGSQEAVVDVFAQGKAASPRGANGRGLLEEWQIFIGLLSILFLFLTPIGVPILFPGLPEWLTWVIIIGTPASMMIFSLTNWRRK